MGALQLPLVIAANNGNIGGGEVMQLSIAEAARTLGYDVRIACPATPDPLARAARDRGFSTMAIPGSSRAAYVANLARTLRGKQRGPGGRHARAVPGGRPNNFAIRTRFQVATTYCPWA